MIERHPHVEAYPTIYDPWPARDVRLDNLVTRVFKERILPQYRTQCFILGFDYHASINTWLDAKNDTLRTSFRRSVLPPRAG